MGKIQKSFLVFGLIVVLLFSTATVTVKGNGSIMSMNGTVNPVEPNYVNDTSEEILTFECSLYNDTGSDWETALSYVNVTVQNESSNNAGFQAPRDIKGVYVYNDTNGNAVWNGSTDNRTNSTWTDKWYHDGDANWSVNLTIDKDHSLPSGTSDENMFISFLTNSSLRDNATFKLSIRSGNLVSQSKSTGENYTFPSSTISTGVITADNAGPTINDSSSSSGTTGDDYTFNASVSDNSSIDSVNVYYYTDVSGPSNLSMNPQGGSFYERTVSLPSSATILRYNISAVDGLTNWNETGEVEVPISDDDAPEINETTYGTPTTGEEFEVTANVTDNLNLTDVRLNYYLDLTSSTTAHTNVSMNQISGPSYNYTIGIPSDALTLYYNISAVDNSTNWNETGELSKAVVDNDAPTLNNNTPIDPTTGENFTFNASVTDNIGVENVTVYYWTDVSSPKNVSMSLDSGSNYTYTINVPSSATFLNYNISANDTSDNWIQTGAVNLSVTDNDVPSITDPTAGTPTTGENLEINATVSDNVELSDVRLYYYFDTTTGPTSKTNVSMNDQDSDIYNHTVAVPSDALTLYYNISAVDNSTNWNETGEMYLEVLDNDVPTLSDNSPSSATTGDDYVFNASITDNIDMDNVTVYYWTDVSSPTNVSMSIDSGFNYTHTFTVPSSATYLCYNISANDTSNNWIQTGVVNLSVSDNDAPNIMDTTSGTPTTGEDFGVSASVDDNIELSEVKIYYYFDTTDGQTNATYVTMNDQGSGNYNHTVTVPSNSLVLYYNISAVDNSSNWKETGQIPIDVSDDDAPTFTDNCPVNASTGEEYTFNVSAFDNIGVDNVTVQYWTDVSSPTNKTMDMNGSHYYSTFLVPPNATTIHYNVSVKDEEGNLNESGEKIVDVNDVILPELSDVGSVPGTQETPGYVNISCKAVDNYDVQNVFVNITYPNGTYTNGSMLGYSQDYWYYNHSYVELGTYQYVVWVEDISTNWNSSDTKEFTLVDTTSPEIWNYSDTSASTGDNFKFRVSATDNYEVQNVFVRYWTDVTSSSNESLNPESGNYYEKDITVPSSATELHYVLSARDTSSNWISLNQTYITVLDNDAPLITDNSPENGSMGETFVFNASVSDNIEVSSVRVNFWSDVTSADEYNMTEVGQNYYQFSTVIPDGATELHYVFSSNDTSDNWNSTSEFLVVIDDSEAPTVSDTTSGEPTTGDYFEITATVTDNYYLNSIKLYYYFNTTTGFTTPQNVSMSSIGGEDYMYEVLVPDNAISMVYNISAADTFDNWEDTGMNSFEIRDNDNPYLEDTTSGNPRTGENFSFNVSASDNIAVSSVYIEYWTDVSEPVNRTLDHLGGEEFCYNLTTPEKASSLIYTLSVEDTSGNMESGYETELYVIDVIDPVAHAVGNKTVGMKEGFTVSAENSTDNIGVSSYYWEFGDGFHTSGPVQSHSYYMAGVYNVTVTVSDSAGNSDKDTVTITVVDTENPTAKAGDNREADMDESIEFDASGSSDNIGIAEYRWKMGDGTTLNGKVVTYNYSEAGTYQVTLTVLDKRGNKANDTLTVWVLDTEPPVAKAGEDMSVDKGEQVTFDASGSTDNVGIKEYRWDFGDGVRTTVDSPKHNYTYSSEGIYEVKLTVFDKAGLSDSDVINVTVGEGLGVKADAGDDKSIIQGEEVTLDASNSTTDATMVSYNWTFIYNDSQMNLSGEQVSFTFEEKGDYTITLTVKDSKGFTDKDTVTISVSPDSDNDGIPDTWEEKYQLNPNDENDATKDEDRDGYTNLEEYEANTDPLDPDSHPGETSKGGEEEGFLNKEILIIIAIIVGAVLLFIWYRRGKENAYPVLSEEEEKEFKEDSKERKIREEDFYDMDEEEMEDLLGSDYED